MSASNPTFLGLTHLGIALLVLVLGGTRRSDQRSVNHRTTLHAQAFLSQHGIDLGEDGNRQLVLFQQVTVLSSGITSSKGHPSQQTGAARECRAALLPWPGQRSQTTVA